MNRDWFAYDDVAEAFAGVAESLYFTEPARDLVAALDLEPGMVVLDAGCGSGAILRALPPLRLFASDPSLPILRIAKERVPAARAVVSALPHLPFRASSFDVITLGFVLSHVRDLDAALGELASLLRPGGQLGVTAWGTSPGGGPAGAIWQETAERYVESRELAAAVAEKLPWEAEMADAGALGDRFRAAGFTDVRVQTREYELTVPTNSYIESRTLSATSRFVRERVDDDAWNRFLAEAGDGIRERCGAVLRFATSVNVATTKKPRRSGAFRDTPPAG